MKQIKLLFPLFIAGLFFFNASSAQSGYMKLGDIKGESTDKDHKDWIIIESVSQGFSKPAATGQSRRRGTAVVEDMSITKSVDKATPKLLELCVNGKVVPEVIIDLTNAQRTSYYNITMKNVLVSSYSTSASCSGSCESMDKVSLNFEEITWTYTDLSDPNRTKITSTYRVDKNM